MSSVITVPEVNEIMTFALTDQDWFEFLRENYKGGEVNFWYPSAKMTVRIPLDSCVTFFLKKPIRKVGGFGYVERYEKKNLKDAWSAYGTMNGSEDFNTFESKFKSYALQKKMSLEDYKIGCLTLSGCRFFGNEHFIETEPYGISIGKNVVRYKSVDRNSFPDFDQLNKQLFSTPSAQNGGR